MMLVAGFDQVRRAAPLGADLDDAAQLACGLQHGLAFDHVDADRLLQVEVGPGLHGGDRGKRVPVVGRGDQNDVEILLRQHLAVVAIGARRFLRSLARGHDLGGLGQHLAIDVAQRDDLDRLDLDQPQEVALAVPAAADQSNPARGGPSAPDRMGADGW